MPCQDAPIMAILKKERYPAVGAGVVATVDKLEEHGAYVTIDSFNGLHGYLPINEIASGWIKNIHDYAKEGRKLPLKVVMVDPSKGQVVLSLKKISAGEQQRVYAEWTKAKKAEAVALVAAKTLGKTKEETYKELLWPLEEKYGDAYSALQRTLEEGPDALKKAGVSDAWISAIYPLVSKHVKAEKVSTSAKVQIFYSGEGGIEKTKEALHRLLEVLTKHGSEGKITYLSAPYYLLRCQGKSYKELEAALSDATQFMSDYVKKTGGSFSLERQKS